MGLTSEEKKILNIFCKILQKLKIDSVHFSYYFSHDSEEYNTEKFVSNDYSDNGDIPSFELLEKLPQKIYEEYDLEQYVDDESKWQEIRIKIDCQDKIIIIYVNSTYMEPNYYDTSIPYSEMNEEAKKGFDEMRKNLKGENCVIDFSGYGDAGSIEGMTTEGDDVDGRIEDFCYKMLESEHLGWEIDAGSSGNFTINFAENKIDLDFALNTEREEEKIITKIPFG
jgi:hypothetical protein